MLKIFLLTLLIFSFLHSTCYEKSDLPYAIKWHKEWRGFKHCGYKPYYAFKGSIEDKFVDKWCDGHYWDNGKEYIAHFFKCDDGWSGYEAYDIVSRCPAGGHFNFDTKKCECPANTYLDTNTNKCVPSHCSSNLRCPVGMNKDYVRCRCVCPAPMRTEIHCVPATDLNKTQCEELGGVYMENSISDTFKNIDNAIASLYAPPGEHYCYSRQWVEALKNEFKAHFNVKDVILTAVSILPVGRLARLAKWALLGDKIMEEAETPANLLENKYVIDTKYNPETGVYEPLIEAAPRGEKVDPELLFNKPKDLPTAEKIIDTTGELRQFLESDLVRNTNITSDSELTQAAIAYDLERATQKGEDVATLDDLREIFKRSTEERESNLPVPIKDTPAPTSGRQFPAVIRDFINAEGDTIPATIIRKEIKPVNITNNYKTYNVTYNIIPQGASKPLEVTYKVTIDKTSPTPQIQSEAHYKLGETKHVGTLTIIDYSKGKKKVEDEEDEENRKNNNSNENENQDEEDQKEKVNVNAFLAPTENAIKSALNYKVVLFTCPSVSPRCPNDINITIKGHTLVVKDLTCALIDTIDNPNISPKIDLFANLIVLFAGITGLLTLFRRS